MGEIEALVHRQIAPGRKPRLRALVRTMPVDTEPAAIKLYYAQALQSDQARWRELAIDQPSSSEGWAFTFDSPSGQWVFAVYGLNSRHVPSSQAPLTILTNLPEKRR